MKKVGILFQNNARNIKDFRDALLEVLNAIPFVEDLCKEGGKKKVICSEVIVLVPALLNYKDVIHTIDKLILPSVLRITVLDPKNDFLDGILNRGVELFSDFHVDYMVVASNIIFRNMDVVIQAFNEEAKVVCIAHSKLNDTMLDSKFLDTFPCWDVQALNYVGCFGTKKGVRKEIGLLHELICEYNKCIAMFVSSKALKTDVFQEKTNEINRLIESGIMPDYPKEIT